MAPESEDPRVVRVVAVTAADVVAAHEASEQAGREAVLRLTPPFSGRMRARLHAADATPADGADEGPRPVEIPPGDLLSEAVPPYPRPDDTEDELRADPDVEYSRERHRRRHQQAVEAWRERAREGIVDSVEMATPDGTHEVRVVVLGE